MRRSLVVFMTVGAMLSATSFAVAADRPDDPAGSRPPFHAAAVLFHGAYQEKLNGISYHSFRIPAIVRTTKGTVLAFSEGRVRSNKDYGDINIVYKRRANDGSKRWSGLKEAVGAGMGTWGNPTPVVDQRTGVIWLFMSHNDADKSQDGGRNPDTLKPTKRITHWGERRVFVMKSTDDGATFTGTDGKSSMPTDMTEQLLPKKLGNGDEWAWDAIGPGAGVSTSDGKLVIPALHRNIYSTDHGKTWHVQKLPEGTTESTITELGNGKLYRNDRPEKDQWAEHKRRWVSFGRIDGRFSKYRPDAELLDPRSEASVLQYNKKQPDAPARTIFLNSASTETRTKMRVRISYDNARTWPVSRPLDDESLPPAVGAEGGYSSMTKADDHRIGALVESNDFGANDSTRSIIYREFNLSWILHG